MGQLAGERTRDLEDQLLRRLHEQAIPRAGEGDEAFQLMVAVRPPAQNLQREIYLGRCQQALALPRADQICSSGGDRKSTRLNSSHVAISYAVFCLKKKINY